MSFSLTARPKHLLLRVGESYRLTGKCFAFIHVQGR